MDNDIDLEEEYEKMELEYPTDTILEVKSIIDFNQDTIEESRTNTLKLMKQYYRRIFFSGLFYLWQKLTDSEQDIDFYQAEIKLLQQEVDLSLEFQGMQTELLASLDNDNFQCIGRLSQFVDLYYEYNFCYFERKRDVLYYQQQGIGMVPSYEGTRHNLEEFKDFFEKKLTQNNLGKGIEKTKKI